MTDRNAPPGQPRHGITRRQSLLIGVAGSLGTTMRLGVPSPAQAAEAQVATRIWDDHCHLSAIPGSRPGDRMAKLIEYADRMRVERLVVFMGWPFSYNPSPDELRRQNDQVLEAIRDWSHRAFGYVYVSPEHVDSSLKEIDRCVANGPMVGIKLWVAKKCSDRSLDPIIELATQLQVPIYQHTWLKITGNLPGESTASDLAELARRHPEAMLICGHAGGDWEQGIRAIRAHKNVYLETAGGDPTAGIVEMAVRELGAQRVVYGSDAGGRSFASQLAKVESAEISDREKEQILGGNLRRLLTPILQAKGVRF